MNEQLFQIYGYLHGMWRYRWSALVIAWLVAIIGWPVALMVSDKYEARTEVYVDTSSVMKPLLRGLAPETDTDDELQVMSRTLLSRENLLGLIRETDLDLKIGTPREREAMLETLAAAVEVKGGGNNRRGNDNNIYEISYHSTSPTLAYQVVSYLLNSMINGALSSTRMNTQLAQKFLDSQIAEHERRLTEAEQKLAAFKKANVGFMPDERGGYYLRLQRAQDDVEQTRSALRLAERRHAELQKQLKGESPVLSGGYASNREAKIQRYRQQLDSLLDEYTGRHPDVLAVKAIIAELKAGRDAGEDAAGDADATEFNPVYQEMKVELNRASVEIGTLKTQQAEQEAYVKRLKGSIDIIPEVEAKLAKLNRGYEVTRERYLELVERRESALLAQSAGISTGEVSFRVIEPPIVPTKPSSPNRLLLLVAVLLAAFAVGLGWSFLRYMLAPTFIDIRQVASATGLPVLGTVSLYLSPAHKRRRRAQLASFLSASFLLIIAFLVVLLLRDTGVSFFAQIRGR